MRKLKLLALGAFLVALIMVATGCDFNSCCCCDRCECEKNQSKEIGKPEEGDMRPEFKDALDKHEAFMNEYIIFMEKYKEDGNTLCMRIDYFKYTTKYSKSIKKIDALYDSEMTKAESDYYIDVTLRVSRNLSEALNK